MESMKCRYCQSDIGPYDNFCINCGRSTKTSIKEGRKCRYCGKPLPLDSEFCIECGHAVDNPMEDEIFLKKNGYLARKENRRKVAYIAVCVLIVAVAVMIGAGAQPNNHANVDAQYNYVGEIGYYQGMDGLTHYPAENGKFIVYAVKVASYDLDRTDVSLWVQDVYADLTKGRYASVHKVLNKTSYSGYGEINPDFEIPYKYESVFYLLFHINKDDYPIGLTY